jgi:uncharacterized NAD-dependent epimerase/dehydratase family protein
MNDSNSPAAMSAAAPVMRLPYPYLLFLGDATEAAYAKTAFGLLDWAPERCIAEWGCDTATVSTGLQRLSPREARARGARGLVIGIANTGGIIGESWVPLLVEALESGLDIVSGLHVKLGSVPALKAAAARSGRRLIDIRTPPPNIPCGIGSKRAGKRLLTVGTDCAIGKKYSALSIARAFGARGHAVDFRATGQTGILISGGGMPMDAVVADFEAGAAESLSPAADPAHWDVIEGQGSLFHPAYAAVSLGLLHGSQPDVIVVCHQPGRECVLGHPDFALPSIAETIDLNLRLGRLTNPAIRCGGISLNTSHLELSAARELMALESARLSLPVADPMRPGMEFAQLIDSCLD